MRGGEKYTKKKNRQRGGPGILREITGAIMKNTICKLDKEKKEIYVMLKLVEGLVKQGIVTETIFKGMLSDFRKNIDTSQFDCYTEYQQGEI